MEKTDFRDAFQQLEKEEREREAFWVVFLGGGG